MNLCRCTSRTPLLSVLQFYAHVYLCGPSKISLLIFIFPFDWNCKTGFSQVYNDMHSTSLKPAFKQFHFLVWFWPVKCYRMWQAIIWFRETLNPSCAAIQSPGLRVTGLGYMWEHQLPHYIYQLPHPHISSNLWGKGRPEYKNLTRENMHQ